MAIPIGTTYRQLTFLARWSLAGVAILALVAWWWPGFHTWASMTGGLLAVWGLWTFARTVRGDRSIPGHPIHLAILVPVLILAFHATRDGLLQSPPPRALAGAMDISVVVHLSLLSLGVLLSQSLLTGAGDAPRFQAMVGMAMMLGADLAAATPQTGPARPGMAMLGLAGVLVWLAPLWPFRPPEVCHPHKTPSEHPLVRKMTIAGWAAVALLQVAVLVALQPSATIFGGSILAGVLLLAGGLLHVRRGKYFAAGGAMLLVVGAGAAIARPALPTFRHVLAGPLGQGEGALRHVEAADPGLIVLGSMVGWGGLMWLLGGVVVCMVLMLGTVRREAPGRQASAVLWTAATMVGTAALLSPGGLFLPGITMGAALLWGLLPSMADRKPRNRSGWWMIAWLGGILVLIGLLPSAGLVIWMMESLYIGDKLLHAIMGGLLTMLLAWLAGSRSVWWGLVGIASGMAVGAAGEALQGSLSPRGAEVEDAIAHAGGGACVLPVYLLCIGSRWAESRQAQRRENTPGGYGRIPGT